MLHLDYCVIGGGIVGLAVGAALSPFGSVAVLERNTRLLQETSSRNSGVVHSGLYYPSDSLKTALCMAGNQNTWRLQQRFPSAVHARRSGKWIGACSQSEDGMLTGLMDKMKERRIPYTMVPQRQAQWEEPLVRMRTIVNSTDTGIIDVHSLADFYRGVIERASDGYVLCDADVTRFDIPERKQGDSSGGLGGSPVKLTVAGSSGPSEPYTVDVDKAVVCAVGLHANTLWGRTLCDGVVVQQPQSHRLHACKGRYAGYRGKAPVSRLVYPCPLPSLVGLGVHSVLDMAGQVRFGPDAVYVDAFDDVTVATSPGEEEAFLDSQYAAVRRYMPRIDRQKFFADYAGVRPKLAGPGEGFRDFLIEYLDHVVEDTASAGSFAAGAASLMPIMKPVEAGGSREGSGVTVVWLNGIESPGLTASSAIGDHVTSWLVGPRAFQAHLPPWSPTGNSISGSTA